MEQRVIPFLLPYVRDLGIDLVIVLQLLVHCKFAGDIRFLGNLIGNVVDHAQPHAADTHDEVWPVVLHYRRPFRIAGVTHFRSIVSLDVSGNHIPQRSGIKHALQQWVVQNPSADPVGGNCF